MSFRTAMRNPGIPAKADTRKRHFTGPRIECGVCSFFSAARRTNQEAPPLLSGFVARRLAPPSGAAELAALRQSSPSCLGRLASSRPDKGGGGTLRRIVPVIPRNDAESRNTICHSRLDLESRKYSGVNTSKSFLSFWTPHRCAG